MPLRKSTRYRRLQKEIANLQQLADSQKHHYKSSKELLYEGLSRVYMLWREANKEKGLLDRLYSEYNIQYKSQTIHDIQFSPLLRYLWNMDGSVNSNTIDQWNRALNKIHTEVQTNKQYYARNTTDKLITFIHSKGGITALTDYFEDTSAGAAKPKRQISKAAEKRLDDAHLTNGKHYFSSSTPLARINARKLLVSIDSGLALALLRKCDSGYEVVSTVDNEQLTNDSIVAAYKRTSKNMPYSARLITEIIRSQAMPTKMAALAPSLAELSEWKAESTNERMKRLKRLMYIAQNGTFVLSENRSKCSVVTTATPISPIFKKKEKNDLALAVGDRTFIENRLIQTDDFNFYTTDAKRYVPEIKEEAASYRMKLENTVTKEYRFIRFYKLNAYKFPPSRTQAVLIDDSPFRGKYKAVLNDSWIRDMNMAFLTRWVNGFGKKIKRAENKVLKIAFGKTGITFQFNRKAEKFKEKEIISFGRRTAGKTPFSATVLSKDIVPVLYALTTMEIDGNVTLVADDEMAQFKFVTDCADYAISVPFCNNKGKRYGDYMEAYGE